MHAIRHQVLPASGVEYATYLHLTPSSLRTSRPSSSAPLTAGTSAYTAYNLVVARANVLRIFDVRRGPPPPPSAGKSDARARKTPMKAGTEPLEGEVILDEGGEGFLSMGAIKAGRAPPTPVSRLHLLREHHLHGTVTGIERVRTVASLDDGLDRLLVSFKDAKIALLEWSEESYDLLTVSLHTYERAPQLNSMDATLFRSKLRVDPASRCALLSLPQDAVAVLPFHQTAAELDAMDTDERRARDIPYAPSYVLDLHSEADNRIRNVIDFCFLPGFAHPTLAVLFQPIQTWTARITEHQDTCKVFILTLDTTNRRYAVITAVDGLPFDSERLTPCPSSLGGVLVTTPNAVVHIDPSARRAMLAVNGWAAAVSNTLATEASNMDPQLSLSCAQIIFVDEQSAVVVTIDGVVRVLTVQRTGRNVTALNLGSPLAHASCPTLLLVSTPTTSESEDGIPTELFVGSTAGASLLLRIEWVEDTSGSGTAMEDVKQEVKEEDPMFMDDDDLYGDSQPKRVEIKADKTRKLTALRLSLADYIPGHGPIADMIFGIAKIGERLVPELVLATGVGPQAGLTLLQRDLPMRLKRKIHAIGGGRGLWALPIRPSHEKPSNLLSPELPFDTVILSTDANPSPGLSRVARRAPAGGPNKITGDVVIDNRVPGTTVGAAPFFQRTAILHVMSNMVRVLEPNGSERQTIQNVDGKMTRPKIRYASICDPYVLVIRDDDSLGLFIGREGGTIRRKDMSPMGEKTSQYVTGCFYTDKLGLFNPIATANAPPPDEKDASNTVTLHSVVDANAQSQWLFLVRPQGVLEIWALPKLSLVFSTSFSLGLQQVLVDSYNPPALSIPTDPPRAPEETDVEQILVASLGEGDGEPHLFVYLRSGHLAVYQILASAAPSSQTNVQSRSTVLPIKMIRIVSRAFGAPLKTEDNTNKPIALGEQRRAQRSLVPFTTRPSPDSDIIRGVFFTGDQPCWIIRSARAGVRIHPSGHNVVHAFTACSLWDSEGDFLMYTDEGPCLLEWQPSIDPTTPLPSRYIPRPRPYTNITFDPSTGLVVGCANLHSQFASYDEDNNVIWEPNAPDVAYPTTDCSTLELISPETWKTMDGYEFLSNEFVTAIDLVTLETQSNEAGLKEFIAVATTIDRGEDLAVKGAIYIFDIVEVVPDVGAPSERRYKLRLCCRDEAKGPVTALCGINGYLVSSMGQKIFIRAFDLDERLVGVAFLDVGVYVTSLRSVKNFIVMGDAVKSVWFLGFQEDPYKLVVLAKDVNHHCVTRADFFFNDKEMSIVTADEDGVIRLYAYDPHDPDSKRGQELICRTEFAAHAESRSTLMFARRAADEPGLPATKLLYGGTDGSLTTLTPVEEAVGKRLQLLQGQLSGKIQHVAGLNPRAFRIVRNDHVSRPLSKGILDASLLQAFIDLPISRQDEFTRQIGTDRETVLKDWAALSGLW